MQLRTRCGAAHISADDCYEISQITWANEDYYHAAIWSNQTVELLKKEEKELEEDAIVSAVTEGEGYEILSDSLVEQGNPMWAVAVLKDYYETGFMRISTNA